MLTHSAAGARYAAERQAWEHDRSDWDHWRGRLQEDLDAARALAGLDHRKAAVAALDEATARGAAERANLERCGRGAIAAQISSYTCRMLLLAFDIRQQQASTHVQRF